MAALGALRGQASLLRNATWARLPALVGSHVASQLTSLRAAMGTLHVPQLASGTPRTLRSVSCRFYAAPDVYDIAFSFRDFEAEAAFLLQAYQEHSAAPLTRFLDVGCGPARHAAVLAAAGVQAVGLDSSPEMIQYARRRAERAAIAGSMHFACADMAAPGGFLGELPGGRVDLAALMLGTLTHCADNAAALRCFHNLAEAVRPGGLLVLELPHPDELFDGSLLSPDGFVDCWEAKEGLKGSVLVEDDLDEEAEGDEEERVEGRKSGGAEAKEVGGGEGLTGRRVLVEYGREGDEFDGQTQVLRRTVGLSLFDPDGSMVSSEVEVVPQRQFTLQEVDLLARAAGFEVVAVHGDVATDVPLSEGYRMVVCLVRNGEPQ